MFDRIESFQLECEFSQEEYQHNRPLVSVSSAPCDTPENIMLINDNTNTYRATVNYTVCISGPTKYNYSDYQRFIEWMELNMIFGVRRTIIYNVDVAPVVLELFNYYKRKGLLEVYNVNPPYIEGDDRWIFNKREDPAYAKISMRHDCLMREMFRTRYVAFIDLDESVVPRSPGDYTWDDMIESANYTQCSYIMARNVFYRRDWGVDSLVESDLEITKSYRLLSLTTTNRDKEFYPPMTRSKNMVQPEFVLAASTHRAFMINGHNQLCILPTHVGALHHYKFRANKLDQVKHIQDITTHKYITELKQRVAKVYSDMQKELQAFGITEWNLPNIPEKQPHLHSTCSIGLHSNYTKFVSIILLEKKILKLFKYLHKTG